MDNKENKIKKNTATGASAAAGAAVGVVGGSLLTDELRAEEVNVEVDTEEQTGNQQRRNDNVGTVAQNNHEAGEVIMATGVDDNMSFSEAFAAARAEVGPGGAFVWRGQVYGTYYASEWNSMTAEEKSEYYSHFNFTNVNHEPVAAVKDVHHVVEVVAVETVTDNYGNEVDLAYAKVDGHRGFMVDYDRDGKADKLVVDYNDNGAIDKGEVVDLGGQRVGMPAQHTISEPEMKVEVLDVETIADNQGNAMDVAVIKVNGHDGVVADIDRDGTADVLMVDANDNGVIENNEVADLRGQGVEMAALSAQVQDTPENVYYAQNDPDYVNDADVHDYFA